MNVSGAQSRQTWATALLPLFLTKENKAVMGALLGAFALIVYLSSNHIHLFPPQLLPMSFIDKAVPFMPNTVWIYMSEYVYFIIVYVLTRDMVNLNKYFYSFLALQCVSVLIFWAWPTTYPRDLFPLPPDLNWITYHAFSSLRVADSPANCAPSLHVSSVYLSAFIFLDEQKKKFPFFFVWGTAIAISTLTTKQHYLVDVVSGFLMAVVFHLIFHRFVSYRALADYRGARGAVAQEKR